MDTTAATIVFGIAALIISPFILYYLYKKREGNKFLKYFLKVAESEKVNISQKELWNNCYAIGIDIYSKKIIYIKRQKGKDERTLIDLSEVKECRIVNENRKGKTQYEKNNRSERLELVFTFHNSEIAEKALEFYESASFMPDSEDFSKIENWMNIVNLYLKH